MPIITERDIARIDLEGEFQEIKAKSVSIPDGPAASETAGVLRDQLVRVIDRARQHQLADIVTKASLYLIVFGGLTIHANMQRVRQDFLTAAQTAKGLEKAREIAKDGPKKLIFLQVDKGLAKLFDALGSLKDGLSALKAIGVDNDAIDTLIADLDKAGKAAADKAKPKEK